MKKTVLCLVLCLFCTDAFAQQERAKRSSGPRRQLATIVFAGLGGAILGLSTLSFYGRPQDQLSNIAIGFAVGVIAGTTYVTFRSATTREYLEEDQDKKGASLEPPEKVQFAPLLRRVQASTDTALGAQMLVHF